MWVVARSPQKVLKIVLTNGMFNVILLHDEVEVDIVYVRENDELVKGQVIGWVEKSCQKGIKPIYHI